MQTCSYTWSRVTSGYRGSKENESQVRPFMCTYSDCLHYWGGGFRWRWYVQAMTFILIKWDCIFLKPIGFKNTYPLHIHIIYCEWNACPVTHPHPTQAELHSVTWSCLSLEENIITWSRSEGLYWCRKRDFQAINSSLPQVHRSRFRKMGATGLIFQIQDALARQASPAPMHNCVTRTTFTLNLSKE